MLSEHFLNDIYPYFSSRLRSENTRKGYLQTLREICNFAQKDFPELSYGDVKSFSSALRSGKIRNSRGEKFADASANVMLARLRSVAAFLEESAELFGIIYESPFRTISVADPDDISAIPDVEDIDLILRAAPNQELKVIFLLAWRCTLTMSEIITLKTKDLLLDKEGNLGIVFKKKGCDDRYVKIPKDIRPDVDLYLSTVPKEQQLVFLNNKKRPFTNNYFSRVVSSVMENAGTKKIWTFRSLRHAGIVHMLVSGASPSAVATYIGVLPKWIKRYSKVVEDFHLAPCDLSLIQAKASETKMPL